MPGKKANEKSQKNNARAKNVVNSYNTQTEARTDPMGSWTGRPADPHDVPAQDADDL